MTWNEANTAARKLWTKWVSDKPHDVSIWTQTIAYDLDRIHASMLRETRFHRTGKSNASAGLISEVRGELVLLGKIRKALAPKTCGHQLTESEFEYYENRRHLDRLCKRCAMEERAR